MLFIYLILITSIFSLPLAKAEIPYAQKILLNAEYDRAEKTLESQISDIKKIRENIKKGKTSFDEVRHLTESLYVYTLESVYRFKNKSQFQRLAHLLNNNGTRGRFYYPVNQKGGFSGKNIRYVAWKDEGCIKPIQKNQIQTGVFIEIRSGSFKNLNFSGTDLIFTEKYFATTNKEQILKSYPLASFKIKDKSPISAALEDLKNLSSDLAEYYNCNYVTQFATLEKANKQLYARYLHLAKILNKTPVNFNKEKKEKTLGEELNELTSTIPKTEAPSAVSTDEDLKTTP